LGDLISAIDQQRKILHGLERQKSTVQFQLNSLFDPMALLPVEISSQIFMRCLPKACECSEYYEPHSEDAPLLLMKVCGRWSYIALSTPTLWSTIHAHFP
ncbi:hypothetical protein C8J57DRAFT_1026300, partial [Mycena rebaudengoi]